MYVDSNKPLERGGAHTTVFKYRIFLPLLLLIIWLTWLFFHFSSPKTVGSERRRVKVTLQILISDNRHTTYAASELRLLLHNWIIAFEVPLLYCTQPLLSAELSGTAPIPAASQMLLNARRVLISSSFKPVAHHDLMLFGHQYLDYLYLLQSIAHNSRTQACEGGKLAFFAAVCTADRNQVPAQCVLDQLFKYQNKNKD